jgi:hypothetical protein
MVNVLTAPKEHLEFWEKVEDDMAEIHGDATQDDVDQLIKKTLNAGIASATETNPVRLTIGEATRVLELLGGYDPDDDPDPNAVAKSAAPRAAPQAAPTTGKMTRVQLNDMTKDELVEYADDHDIEVTASWPKADIVDAIVKHK